MIHALKPKQRYYNRAYYLPRDKEIQYRELITYKVMGELQKKYAQAIQNMITNRRSYVIITNSIKEYEVGDRIYTGKNDDMYQWHEWYIKNCFMMDFQENEQAKRFVKDTIGKYWVLELA